MLISGKLISYHKGGICYEVGKQSHCKRRFDRHHRPVHPCQLQVALATTTQEVSAMKWGSKVTASAVSIATIVLSILASYKWH
jgi:hypothetical protein